MSSIDSVTALAAKPQTGLNGALPVLPLRIEPQSSGVSAFSESPRFGQGSLAQVSPVEVEPLSDPDQVTAKSVVEARQLPPEPVRPDVKEARLITEAFQADLGMTALLAIIRGADAATVAALLDQAGGGAAPAAAQGETPL